MMDLAKNLVEEANEMKTMCMQMMVDEDMFDYMPDEALLLYKKMFNLMDTSMKLVLEQAALFEAIDGKIDKLLAKTES